MGILDGLANGAEESQPVFDARLVVQIFRDRDAFHVLHGEPGCAVGNGIGSYKRAMEGWINWASVRCSAAKRSRRAGG